MDDSFNYDMDDNSDHDSNDSQESDLQQTQSTQQASQQPLPETDDTHLWGYLQPCTSGLTRIDFWKIHPRYTIGRNKEFNQVVFPGFKISESLGITHLLLTLIGNNHCVISWDGRDSVDSSIVVEDLSSNGTFVRPVPTRPSFFLSHLLCTQINGERIGKGHSRILREGNEIAFGTCIPQLQNDGLEDYRTSLPTSSSDLRRGV